MKFPAVLFWYAFPCWAMVWLLSCFSFWFAWLDSYCCSARKESRNISVKFLFFYVGSGSPLLFMFTVIYGKDGRWSVISFTESPLFLHISCKYIVYDCGWMCSNFTLFCDCGIYSLQKKIQLLLLKSPPINLTFCLVFAYTLIYSLLEHAYVIIWGPVNTAYHDVCVPAHINLNSYAFTNSLQSQSVNSTVL